MNDKINEVFVKKVANNISEISRFVNELPLNEVFSENDTVILKPNFVAPRYNYTGATTNLLLIEAVTRKLQDMGADPVLMEMPGMEFSINEVYQFLDIHKFCKRIELPLYIPQEEDFIDITIPDGKYLKKIRIPSLATKAKIFSLPVMKTHVITVVTLSIKNQMGLLHNNTRRDMHAKGIHKTLEDMYKVLYPDFAIIDAINSMQGDGAVYGDVVKSKTLFASRNSEALDKTALDFMGINIADVPYLNSIISEQNISLQGNFRKMNYKLPRTGRLYNIFYRYLYVADLIFNKFFDQHFNTFLYKKGLAGTRPVIKKKKICSSCLKCITECPVGAISKNLKINRTICLRCLHCYEICPNCIVKVKGISKPESQ